MHFDHQHSLKNALKEMVDTFKWNDKLHETRIRQLWSEKMGTTINQYTRELQLRKGILFISITSASLKQELSFEKEKIATMLNADLQADIVKEVVIR